MERPGRMPDRISRDTCEIANDSLELILRSIELIQNVIRQKIRQSNISTEDVESWILKLIGYYEKLITMMNSCLDKDKRGKIQGVIDLVRENYCLLMAISNNRPTTDCV
jgi:hypothetical protein